MQTATQAFMIIATFSLAHERFVEFLRWWIPKIHWRLAANALDRATCGAWAWLPAIGLSLATNANLLDAFRLDSAQQPVFFTNYLNGPPPDARAFVGCCIMGLAVTLGSSFWHDVAKGLIDVRGALKDTRADAERELARTVLRAAPAVPSSPGLVPA